MAKGLTITGDKQLERKLRKLPPKVQKAAAKSGLTYAAKRPRKLMRDKAKAIKRSGTLAKSIGTRVKSYRRTGISVAVIGPRVGFIAPNGQSAAKYGIMLERGANGMQPQPFVRQTLAQTEPFAVRDFKTGIGNRIEKLAKARV